MISASLVYNKLDAAEGFASFDVDEDGMLSLADLSEAVESLQLDLSEAQVRMSPPLLGRIPLYGPLHGCV